MNKVLVIITRYSDPPISGGDVRCIQMIEALHSKNNVELLYIEPVLKKLKKQSNDNKKKLTYECKVTTTDFILNGFTFLFKLWPIQSIFFYSREAKRKISELLNSGEYSIVFSNMYRGAIHVPKSFESSICDMVDSYSISYRRNALNTKSILYKIYYSTEAHFFFLLEKKLIERSLNTVFINEFEQKYWSSLIKNKQLLTIPNAVSKKADGRNFVFKEKYSNYISYLGKLDYMPNIEAILWFSENVLKFLPLHIQFHLIGKDLPEQIKTRLEKKFGNRVKFLGFVDNPYQHMFDGLCVVAPMHIGGGVQNKVLEAMYSKCLNIISSHTANSFKNIEDKKHAIISDNSSDIIEYVLDIAKNSCSYNGIRELGFRYVNQNYSNAKIEKEWGRLVV